MRHLALGLLLCTFGLRLLAVTPVPFTVPVSFTTRLSGSLTGTLTVYAEATVTVSNSASGGTSDSVVASAALRPGKSYPMNMAGTVSSGSPAYKLSFISPQGYTVYIDGVPADLYTDITVSGSYSDDHTLELRPNAATKGGLWGSFSGIAVGKAVAWSVGLGDLRTGRSAGGIRFNEPDLTNSPASRSRLYYAAPPTNVGQIVVVKDGASNQTLRQIVTPIGFTDIVDVTGGYEIRCYFWGQVASWNGTLYTFTGSPWKTIKVESTAANQLKVTETEGISSPVVRVSLLAFSTSTGGPLATGGTVTQSGGYTVHTFTGNGTFTALGAMSVDAVIVAGGGGGAMEHAGGGGAGGVVASSGISASATGHSVVVGSGGGGNTGYNTFGTGFSGQAGYNSSAFGLTAIGGGEGGSYGNPGGSGGSGGGSGYWDPTMGGSGTSGQGNNGNTSDTGSALYGGGGGGAGATASASDGGTALSTWAGTFGGGGGGGYIGGYGGGATAGNGGYSSGGGGTASSNTGSGGGGGGNMSGAGGNGGSGLVVIRYVSSPTVSTYTLQEGNGSTWLRTVTQDSTPHSGYREVIEQVRTGGTSGTVVAKTKYRYENPGWGEELTQVVVDPDTAALTTTYAYHTTSTALGNYRKVKSVTEPTGNWTVFEYYDDWDRRGQLKHEYHPWVDSPATAASYAPTTGRVLYLEYAADWTGRYTQPTLREERINNILVGQTTWSHGDTTGSGEPRAHATINSYRDGSNYHSDYVESYRADADPDFAGQLYKATGANLAQTSGSVSRGTFNTTTKAFAVGSTGDHWRELRFNGSTSATGATAVTGFDSQSCPSVYLIPNQSTLDVTVRIAQGYVYRTEKWVYTGSGAFSLMTAEDFDYDGTGNLTQRWASTGNGALTGYVYTNGRLTSVFDPTGTETQFTYDLLGRVATSVKKGAAASGSYAAQGDITNSYTYDGANRVTQTVSSGGALSQTTTSIYDLAGRLTQTVAPGGYTTTFAYTSGGKIVTATLPGGATRIDESYLDGQPKNQTGTAVVATYTGYTVNSSPGTITRQVSFGTATSTALVKTTTDWLGRPITEEKPSPTGSGTVTTTLTYNSLGQLTKRTQPGLADTLFSYDTMGTLFRECLDVSANGTIDLASSDRITEHGWTFFSPSSDIWWRRDTTTTYATAGSGTATQVGKVEVQLRGLATNRLSLTNTTDIFGNVTSQFVDVNRSGKLVTTTTDAPDSTTDAVTIAYNGLVVSSRNTANHTTTFGFDALGRPVTSVDPRTGTTTTAYVAGTSQVSTVTDPASIVQATYAYDSAGRVASVKDALNKYAYTSYTTRGEVYRQWGDTNYPVENAYDNWGRRTTMKTYRGGSDWTGSTWPAAPGTADTTTWAYQEATGLLSSKTDAASKAVSYTYTQAGQLATRTWARGTVTTYGYSSTTGERLTVDYSDSTPDLSYTYNRLGNQATVTDVTGTRNLNYNLSGTLDLQNEDLPSFFGPRRVTYPRATSGVIGRATGLQLGTSGSPTSEQNVTWGYDTYGRFNSLAGGGTTLAYGYTANSNLLSSISDAVSGWTQTRIYLSNRDLLDVIETKISTTTKGKFDYAHDNLGRRTAVAKTGEMFNRYGNGTQGLDTTWGYDERSQLTSEVTKLGGSGTILTGRDDAYAFDNLGNRSSATHNSSTGTYSLNSLNQYTQRTVPGVFDVAGAAGSGTTVTVNGSNTGVTRHGEYFFKGQSLSNNPNAVFSTLAVSDGTTTVNLAAFLAGTPEAFTYDDDGNQLTDGGWSCVYDAENNLVSATTLSALFPNPIPAADARRLEFKYDYLKRRVQKTVLKRNSGNTAWVTDTDAKFIYDGWNQIAEYNALSTLTLTRTSIWGLDWSGTLQGAGGVGGLALTVEGGNTYLPMFDGNGNKMGSLKASDGSMASAFEYDAFGNTLRESGPYAASDPWRFSTKYTDIETGLVYYGLRYYSPTLGRFINQDPIAENGGLNLYGFVGNNGVNRWDYLGMDPLSDWMEENGLFPTQDTGALPPAGGYAMPADYHPSMYDYAPSPGMFQDGGVYDPVAKTFTIAAAVQNAMEGVSFMGQAMQSMGDALAAVDGAMARNLAIAAANGTASMQTLPGGTTVVLTRGDAATSAFNWVAAGISESYGSNIVTDQSRQLSIAELNAGFTNATASSQIIATGGPFSGMMSMGIPVDNYARALSLPGQALEAMGLSRQDQMMLAALTMQPEFIMLQVLGEASMLSRMAAAERVSLTAEQAANVARFENKLPGAAQPTVLRPLPNGGVAAQADVPGRVPGSFATYEKQIDSAGTTIQFTKTTVDPAGKIVHVKSKMGPAQ